MVRSEGGKIFLTMSLLARLFYGVHAVQLTGELVALLKPIVWLKYDILTKVIAGDQSKAVGSLKFYN